MVNGPPPDLREAWSDAPEGAADALRHGMAFDPSGRPGTATQFVDELGRALEPPTKPAPEPEPTSATAAMPRTNAPRRAVATAPAAAPAATRPPGRPARKPRDRSLAPLLALLALALVGGILAFVLLSGDDGGGKSDSSSSASAEERREARADRRRARREREQQQAQARAEQQPATPASGTPASGGSDSGGGSDYDVPQPSGDSVDEGARLQLQGHNMLDSDPKGAVSVLERSVEAFPSDTDDIRLQYAYFSLGKALRLAGRPEDAIPVLELRLKNPDQRETVQKELDAAREAAGG